MRKNTKPLMIFLGADRGSKPRLLLLFPNPQWIRHQLEIKTQRPISTYTSNTFRHLLQPIVDTKGQFFPGSSTATCAQWIWQIERKENHRLKHGSQLRSQLDLLILRCLKWPYSIVHEPSCFRFIATVTSKKWASCLVLSIIVHEP